MPDVEYEVVPGAAPIQVGGKKGQLYKPGERFRVPERNRFLELTGAVRQVRPTSSAPAPRPAPAKSKAEAKPAQKED